MSRVLSPALSLEEAQELPEQFPRGVQHFVEGSEAVEAEKEHAERDGKDHDSDPIELKAQVEKKESQEGRKPHRVPE